MGRFILNARSSPKAVGFLIEITEVTKVYGATRAVDGVTFAAPSGTVTGFLACALSERVSSCSSSV
jgi:hypothetical protein